MSRADREYLKIFCGRASRDLGDRRGLARALHNAAEALRLQGQLARARATSEEALSIRRGIDDPASVATSLFGVGQVAAAQGDLASARRLLAEGLEMDRRLDRRRPMAYGLYHLAEIALMQGDLALARRLLIASRAGATRSERRCSTSSGTAAQRSSCSDNTMPASPTTSGRQVRSL